MKYPIEFDKITKSIDFYDELLSVKDKADNYLMNFKWCESIENRWLYLNIGKKFCVFIYEIINLQSAEDNKLWIVVGDIPSMYIDTYSTTSLKEVLLDYVELASEWSEAILNDLSTEDCFPFIANPTKENAELLKIKVNFIKNNIYNNIEDIII